MLAASFDKPGGATCCATPPSHRLSRLSLSLIGSQYSDDSLTDKAWLHRYLSRVIDLCAFFTNMAESTAYYYLHFPFLCFILFLTVNSFPTHSWPFPLNPGPTLYRPGERSVAVIAASWSTKMQRHRFSGALVRTVGS